MSVPPNLGTVPVTPFIEALTPAIENIDVEEPENPITIRQLFTHTAGLTYGLIPVIPAEKVYLKEFNAPSKNPTEILTRWVSLPELEEWIPSFAKIPLVSHPGKHWWYSHGHDVLGYLIEILSGMKLDEFFKKRIFGPLAMQASSTSYEMQLN